jgi:hypothetical protein
VGDIGPAHHAAEDHLIAPFADHARNESHEGIMHIIGRHGGADTVHMCHNAIFAHAATPMMMAMLRCAMAAGKPPYCHGACGKMATPCYTCDYG